METYMVLLTFHVWWLMMQLDDMKEKDFGVHCKPFRSLKVKISPIVVLVSRRLCISWFPFFPPRTFRFKKLEFPMVLYCLLTCFIHCCKLTYSSTSFSQIYLQDPVPFQTSTFVKFLGFTHNSVIRSYWTSCLL